MIHVNSHSVRVKWTRPEEDSSIGTVLDKVLIKNGDERHEIPEDQLEFTLDASSGQKYSLELVAIFENGLQSLPKVINVTTAPEIAAPTVRDRGFDSASIQWRTHPDITEYQIYRIDKTERGKSRLQEVLWHGVDQVAEISGLEPNTEYTLALIGYVENGVTNTEEVSFHTRLQSPEFNTRETKIGIKNILLSWNSIKRTQGFR